MAQLDDVMAPEYLEGLEGWPIDRVRTQRDKATEAETGLSYLRRIVQGRLDIVLSEQRRRQHGEGRGDLDDLVGRLPEILGDRVHAPGLGRLPALIGPGELAPDLTARLETALPVARLDSLPDLEDAALATAVANLEEFEQSLSSLRRAVFGVLDRLQAELVRRYRSGEATVDSLLS